MVFALISIIGSMFLIFRIWLCEVRLKDILDFRRHFLSRFASYYFCITLILSFESPIFNFITISSLPLLSIAFLTFDMPFFIKYKKENELQENKLNKRDVNWLYIERILLHPPIILANLVIYIMDPKIFLTGFGIDTILTSSVLIFGAWFCFDKRAFEKKGTGPAILTLIISSLIGYTFYLLI